MGIFGLDDVPGDLASPYKLLFSKDFTFEYLEESTTLVYPRKSESDLRNRQGVDGRQRTNSNVQELNQLCA